MSLSPRLAASLPAAILETILTGLAGLFLAGANGDIASARAAAAHMLAAYGPESEDELRLAANIVGFSFHALEALGQAADPDLPLTRILRLRGSAVSLSRQSASAERRLEQLRKTRQQAVSHETARPEPVEPQADIELVAAAVQPMGTVTQAAKANGLTWTQAYDNRQRDIRIAASIRRAEARVAAQASDLTPDASARVLAETG